MNKSTILLVLCSAMFLGSCLPKKELTNIPPSRFLVEVYQEGQLVPVLNQQLTLEKKPFVLKITMEDLKGVFFSAAENPTYYDTPDGSPVKDHEHLGFKSRAEKTFNSDREQYLDDESVSFLFYDPEEDWYRFDKGVKVNGNQVIGQKTIEYFLVGENHEKIHVRDYGKPLYFFFLSSDTSQRMKNGAEYGRYKFTVNWKPEKT